MKTIIGTSYFVTYAQEGSIHIGKPPLKPGQKLLVIDNGTRYAIED